MVFISNRYNIFIFKGFLFCVGELGLIIMLISYAFKKIQVSYSKNSLKIKATTNNYKNITFKYKLFYQICLNFGSINKIFKKKLLFFGVGFRCWILNKEKIYNDTILIRIGFSNDVCVIIPFYIKIICLNSTFILIKSYNRAKLIEFCSFLHSLRSLNIYKGKGIFYLNENVSLKQGKSSR